MTARPARLAFAAWGLALALVGAAWRGAAASPGPLVAGSLTVERLSRGARESVRSLEADGRTYLGANTLARLVGATKYWRPDLAKLEVRSVRHSLSITVDAPYVVVDGTAIRLPAAARLVGGEVHVPIEIFPLALSGRFVPRADYDPGTRTLTLFDQEANLGPPTLDVLGPRTRLSLPTRAALVPSVVSARKSRFLVQVGGGMLTALPGDSLAPAGLLAGTRFRREPGGITLDLALDPAAASYKVEAPKDQAQITLDFAPDVPPGFVPFTPEYGAALAHPLRVLVLDPGHGGADSGYVAPNGGPREKDLDLALARLLRARLAQLLPGVTVVLTRDADALVPIDARIEAANHARGDLYLSLHFDAVPGTAARRVTATVAPALGFDSETALASGSGSRPLALIPWRDAAGRYAADSRGLAELLLAALAGQANEPTRLRQMRVLPLEGANMPAVMLECGTLSDPDDAKRLSDPAKLAALADVLARALAGYAHGGFWP